jgi:hypothetical protein
MQAEVFFVFSVLAGFFSEFLFRLRFRLDGTLALTFGLLNRTLLLLCLTLTLRLSSIELILRTFRLYPRF